MMQDFDMLDLGKMNYFLGVEVMKNSKGIFICQSKYERFGMSNKKPVNKPFVPGIKLSMEGSGAKVDATRYK